MSASAGVEFIFFRLRAAEQSSTPGNSLEHSFLQLFDEVKKRPGHLWSSWSPIVEEPDYGLWVVEWSDDSTAPIEELQEAQKLRTQLTPSLSSVGGISATPVVDVAPMAFTAGTTEEQDAQVREALEGMKHAVLTKLPDHLRPSYWCMSTWDSRPVLPHPKSPTGKTLLSIVVVGWESVEQHHKVWEYGDFRATYIGPVKAHMLEYLPGLKMIHAAFK